MYRNTSAFEDYAKCIANPFTAKPVGIPTGSPAASQVYKAYANFTASTGTTGFGYVACTPCTANDRAAANVYTTSAFTGTAVVSGTPGTGGANAAFVQLPYTAANHTVQGTTGATSVVSRVVAWSMRVSNQSATINIGGKIRLGQTQFGNAVTQNFDNQQDLVVGNAYQFPADNLVHEIRWQTSHTSDLEYNNWDTETTGRTLPFSCNEVAGLSMPCMYAFFQAPAGGTTQTYDVQICIVVEYAGYVQTGIPISLPARGLAPPHLIEKLRDMVIKREQSGQLIPAPPKDDWVSWLTRQGDRALNVLFDRPISDPTGREKGTTLKLIRDVVAGTVQAVASKGKSAKAPLPSPMKAQMKRLK